MSKLSKYTKPKIKPVKVKKEKVHKNYGIAKNVKADTLNVGHHVVINENIILSRLIIVAAIFFIAASVFSVVFSILRVENMKNSIIESNVKIEELENKKLNIDYYNELYAYDMVFGKNNIYSSNQVNLTVKLKDIWSYSITVKEGDGAETLLTLENIDALTVFEQDKNYTVKLYENMDEVFLPEIIALKGNFCQGDASDSLDSHFYIAEIDATTGFPVKANVTTNLGGPGKTIRVVDDKKLVKIENVLTYTFTAGADTQIEWSIIFEDFLYDYIINTD